MAEKEGKSTGGKRVAPGSRSSKGAVAAVAVAALLAAGYVGLCAYAGSSGGQLAPGTVISGVEVGGQSAQTAQATLDSTLQTRLAALEVQFSCAGNTYSVPGAEFSYDAEGTVRGISPASGSFLVRGARFLRGLVARDGYTVELKLDHVPEVVSQAARECGGADTQTTWKLTDDALVFTKGRTGRTVDVPALMAALCERAGHLLNNEEPGFYTPLEVAVVEAPPAEPDLQLIHGQVFAQAADAYLDPESKEIVPAVVGKDFDVEAARGQLTQTAEGGICRVALTLTQPELTTEALSEKLFKDLLGEAVTKVTGTSDRRMNVSVAAAFLDGRIIVPGEEFSFNQVCSPYSVSNGYGKATAYVNGLSKDTVAGGICQASSTLYWAALKANMETVERWAHRYEPSYIKGGLDATVYGGYGEEGSLDFRFKNSGDYPIKLEAFMDKSNYLHVNIYGTDTTGIHGEPYSANRVVTQYAQTIYEANESIPQGTTKKDPERTAYNAVTIDTFQKLVDAEGNTVETKQLYTTKYKARNAVILYNPADIWLWNIDPLTGIRAEVSAPPEESGVPVDGGEGPVTQPPTETGTALPPAEGSAEPIPSAEPSTPAVETQAPVLTPPPVPTPSPAVTPSDPNEPLLPPGV